MSITIKRNQILTISVSIFLATCNSGSLDDNVQNNCEAIYSSLVEDQLVPKMAIFLEEQNVSTGSKFNKFNDTFDRYGSGKDHICFYENSGNIKTNLYVRLDPSLSDVELGTNSSYKSDNLLLLRADTYEFPRERGNKSVWCLNGC